MKADSKIQFEVRLMRASSGSSMIACCCLLFMLWKLKKQATVTSKIHTIMFIIASANFLLAASIFIGQPYDGTALCWIQALTTNYFCLVHIFWSTLLSHTLYIVAKDSKATDVFSKRFLFLGFVFPLIVTLLPLTTNDFGNPHGDDRGWCFIDERNDSPGDFK